ncbi:hypothetical protein HAX54_016478 [Datura stramonium]|uniref:Uncharacterized protein n=1 Tax=Datura stramonium TaxID=4076 RepID=A0ABS8UJN4_DATST|nr:hypothetical protein [Datura stramonium]
MEDVDDDEVGSSMDKLKNKHSKQSTKTLWRRCRKSGEKPVEPPGSLREESLGTWAQRGMSNFLFVEHFSFSLNSQNCLLYMQNSNFKKLEVDLNFLQQQML